MTRYLLVESGESMHPGPAVPSLALASDLAGSGHDVTVLLLQNGVFLARRGSVGNALDAAQRAGVRLLADDFSLRERGIGADQLSSAIAPSPLETLVDALAAGHKLLWH